jgi:hypothetical protein
MIIFPAARDAYANGIFLSLCGVHFTAENCKRKKKRRRRRREIEKERERERESVREIGVSKSIFLS